MHRNSTSVGIHQNIHGITMSPTYDFQAVSAWSALLTLFLSISVQANSVGEIWLNKAQVFAQSDTSVPTNPEFEFFTWVGGSFTNASATLTAPGGAVVNYPFLAGEKQFDWFDGVGSPYASKAALDAAYPNGSYVVHVLDDGLDETVTLKLTGDNYPGTPRITNFNDLQIVNPAQEFTISWNVFSNAVTNNSFIELAVEDAVDDDIMYFSQSIIPSSTQSLVIPANTLPANTAMSVYLRFYTFAHIPGADRGAIYESSVDAPLVTVTDSLSDHVFEIEVISGYQAVGLDAPETFADIEVDSDKSFSAVTVLQPGGGTLSLEERDFGQPDRVRWEYEGSALLGDGDYVFTFTSASGNSQTTISYLRADNATPLAMPDLQPLISGVNSAGFIEGTPSTAISWNSPTSDSKISGIFIDGEPRVWEFSDPAARLEVDRSPGEDDAASNSLLPAPVLPRGVYDLELVFHDGHDATNADGISYWVSRERIHEATLLVAAPGGPASNLLSEIEMWFEWSATEHYVDISVTGDLSLTRVKVRTPNEFDFELTHNGSGQWNLHHTGADPSAFDNFGDGIYTFLLEYPDAPRAVQQAMTHLVYLNSDFSPLILPTAAANFTAPAGGSSNDSPVAISWSTWSPGDPAYSELGAGIALEVSNNATDDEFDLAKSATSETVTLDPGSYTATLFFDNGGPDNTNGDDIGLSYGKASRDDLSFSIAGAPGSLTWLDYDDFRPGDVDGNRWDILDAVTVVGQAVQLVGDGSSDGTHLGLIGFEQNMSAYGLRADLSISSSSSNDTAIELTGQIGGGLAAAATLQRDAGGAVSILFSVKNDQNQTVWSESSATPATTDSTYDLALAVHDSHVEFFESGTLAATYTGAPLQQAHSFAIRAVSNGNSYATAASQVRVVRRPYILVVSKSRFYEQSSAAAPTAPVYEFLADIRGYIPSASATFTAPGKAPQAVAFNAGRFEEFFLEFGSQGALDTAYPNGDYLFSITGDFSADVDIELMGDNYPSPAPAFTNFSAMQDVDPDQDFTVTWSSFANPQPNNSLIEIAVETPEEDVIFQASVQPSSTTSLTIPVGTLSPDTTYLVFVRFYTWVDVVASSWGGTYEATTDSTLVTNSGGGVGPTGPVYLETFDAVATGFGIPETGDDGETITIYENPNAGTPANSTGGRASWGDNSAPDAEVVEENPGKFLRLYSDMPGVTAGPSFFGILDFSGFGQGAAGGPFVALDGDDVLGSTVSFEIRLPVGIDYPFYARVLFADSTQLSPAREDEFEEFVTEPLLITSAFPGVWQSISFVDLKVQDFTSLDQTGHTFSGQSNLFALEFLAENGPSDQGFFDLDDVSLTFAAGDRAWEPYDDFVSGGFNGALWSIQTEQSSANPQVVGEEAVFNSSLNDGFSKIEIVDRSVFGVQADVTLTSADNDSGIEIEFSLSDGSSGWLDLNRGNTGQLGISGEVVDTLDNSLWQAPQWSGATDLGIVYSLAVIVEDNRVKFYVDGALLGESQAFAGVGIDYFRLGVWGDAGTSVSGTIDNVEVLRDDGTFAGSITAPQPTVAEEGGTGSFQISIGSPAPAGGVNVVVDVSGTAQQGQDYHLKVNGAQLPDTSSVTITVPQGASSVNVVVEPVDDANPEIEETVILDLVSVDGDAASGQATVTIDHSDIAYFVLWVNRATVNGDAGVGESGQLNWWMVAPIGKSLVSATFTMANGESYQADIEDNGERADLEVETVFGRDGASLADLEAKMQSGTYTALLTYSDSSTETRQGTFTWGAWPSYPVISSPTHYADNLNANNRVTVEWTGGEGWVSLEQTNGPF
ncbi:MAG: hypothetical protein ACI8W8_002840, partial [Rhodothermales bacterium]